MKDIIKSLKFLSIEVLSKNIHKYSRTQKDTWKLRYGSELGEKIILACKSNLSNKKLNEEAYNYILDNFDVKKFKILYNGFDNVNYYDFLNKRYFDKLVVQSFDKIRLKNSENFELTTNKLKLVALDEWDSFEKIAAFLSKLHVKKELRVVFYPINDKTNADLEKTLLHLIENTSKSIEVIQITARCLSLDFMEKYAKILYERKSLMNAFIKFFKPTRKVEWPFDISLLAPYSNSGILKMSYPVTLHLNDESLKSFRSIQNLFIEFEEKSDMHPDEMEENYDSIFEDINFDSVKSIEAYPIVKDNYGKIFGDYVKKSLNLEKLKLSQVRLDNFNLFDLILPSAKTLKILHLNDIDMMNNGEIESFKIFVSECPLQEIYLKNICIRNEDSVEFVKHIGNLHNSLISLTIIDCRISSEAKKLFTRILEKFHNLECVCIFSLLHENRLLYELFKNLENSSSTLRKISIRENCSKKFKRCSSLLNLLNKCKVVTILDLNISLNDQRIPDFLLTLRKLSGSLKTINLRCCWNKKYEEELFDFLSGCTQLKHVEYGFRHIKDINKDLLMISLKNSKYSLKTIPVTSYRLFTSFPCIF